ncbi:hypothetical protein KIN20_014738 [Parelaphostrongylus tenuis]|uniref:Uncharacterized protein n=1 Tax=Parelaphostrongylus tenuis TaxID=148309 RepID=A0AAD5MHJ3_PARTN|nr:hypothetical protein KIN20_014738 [Parelaphostrongylus tenuis]
MFEENKAALEQGDIIGKLLLLFPIGDVELRKTTIRLLFNLSSDAKARSRMVVEGLVAQAYTTYRKIYLCDETLAEQNGI